MGRQPRCHTSACQLHSLGNCSIIFWEGTKKSPISLSLQFILGKGCSDPVIQDGWMVEVSIEKQTVTTGPAPGAERERHSPGSLALEGRSTLLPSVSILGKKGKYLGHPFSSKTNQFCVTSCFLKPSICTDFHLFFFFQKGVI